MFREQMGLNPAPLWLTFQLYYYNFTNKYRFKTYTQIILKVVQVSALQSCFHGSILLLQTYIKKSLQFTYILRNIEKVSAYWI